MKYVIREQDKDNIITVNDGDSFFIPRGIHHMEHICCDCGLRHHWRIRQTKEGTNIITNRVEEGE